MTNELWNKARKESGLARFERESTRKTMEMGRLKLAWKVPGTAEHGKWSMLYAQALDISHAAAKQRDRQKDPAAVALGRKGGLAKVPKGTAKLSQEQRTALAKRASSARWGKKIGS